MPKQHPYKIEYDAAAREQLRELDARDRSAVRAVGRKDGARVLIGGVEYKL